MKGTFIHLRWMKVPFILSLIGILKTDQPPPTDEEVEKIIEEARMKKYG